MTGAGGLWILLHLLYLSVEDIRERQVSLFVIAELGGTGMIYALSVGYVPQPLPGILILLLGRFSNEQIGYGDGWLLLALGMWLPLKTLLWILFLGIGLGTLYALVFRVRELPLVPFLAAAYAAGGWL